MKFIPKLQNAGRVARLEKRAARLTDKANALKQPKVISGQSVPVLINPTQSTIGQDIVNTILTKDYNTPVTPLISGPLPIAPVVQSAPQVEDLTKLDFSTKYGSFNQAFAAANTAGLKQFNWRGNPIAVKFAPQSPTIKVGKENPAPAPESATTTIVSQFKNPDIWQGVQGKTTPAVNPWPVPTAKNTFQGTGVNKINSSIKPESETLVKKQPAQKVSGTGVNKVNSSIKPFVEEKAPAKQSKQNPKTGTGVNKINSSIKPNTVLESKSSNKTAPKASAPTGKEKMVLSNQEILRIARQDLDGFIKTSHNPAYKKLNATDKARVDKIVNGK